ncbi:protein kinase [candidate division KSB1 bacterium]
MIGKTINQYKILEELGSGGMGEVYLAEDTKLERKVALKFLHDDTSGRGGSRTASTKGYERFKREAKAAAKLNHPNIVTIFEIGEHDGDTYIAMEYVAGKSLRDIIDKTYNTPLSPPSRGELKVSPPLKGELKGDVLTEEDSVGAKGISPETKIPIDRVTDIAKQICEGLQEAHKADITHRDIKPENILIDNSGRVKLLDFGLAQMKGVTRLTMESSTVGTAKYMSPEQYKAEDIDHRTDIWSFGVVLFEMLTGKIPFKGEYEAAVMYSVVNTDPEKTRSIRKDSPEHFDRIISKCLEKDPASRFQSMSELSEELKLPSPVTIIEPEPETERSIVVLPFENMSSDPEQEYFSDGLTEEIITDLSYINDLRVISRNSAMMLKGSRKETKTIAKELNVQYVLEGSVRKAGNNLRITAQLINAPVDDHIWAEKYDGTLDDIFDIQEKVSRSIVDALKVKLTQKESNQIADRPIDNVQAYDCWIQARHDIEKYTKEAIESAINNLQNALDIIGDNALLYAGMGYAYYSYVNAGFGGENHIDKAVQYVQKAFVLDPDIPLGHSVLGAINSNFYGDQKLSIEHFNRALVVEPNNSITMYWLGAAYIVVGKMPEVELLAKKISQVDPVNIYHPLLIAYSNLYNGHYERALKIFEKENQLTPEHPGIELFLATTLSYLKRYEEAITLINKMAGTSPDHKFTEMSILLKFALQGKKSEMLSSISQEFEIWAKRDPWGSWWMAERYSLLGMKEKALDWLENSVDRGYINYPHLNEHCPFLENIRQEPRFNKLMKRVKHEWEYFGVDNAPPYIEEDEAEPPESQEKSIIVLPFGDMSPDKDNEYFSDGLTEEIITDLSHIHDLLVISRSSAMTFKGTKQTIPEIVKKVNVRYVLEGSVRKAGNNLRITAQLIDATTDAHLWAEKYKGTLDDIFDIQEKVSRSIVDALKVKLSPKENKQIAERPIDNVQAYECYLRAMREMQRGTEDGVERALRDLQLGLDIIGDNVLLFAGMGLVYCNFYEFGIRLTEETLSKAEEYAFKVHRLEPNSSLSYNLLGRIERYRGSAIKAIKYYKQALSIDPNDQEPLLWLGLEYLRVGKTDIARSMINKLIDRDPLAPLNHIVSGSTYWMKGEYDNALNSYNNALKLEPDIMLAKFFRTYMLFLSNQYDKAYAVIDRMEKEESADQMYKVFTGWLLFLKHALKGEKDKALELITEDIRNFFWNDSYLPELGAGGFALINEKDEAIRWLERAVERGFIHYPYLSEMDPFLENIRGDNRFKKLMERVKHEWENFSV